jgi:hypothetical protein
MRGGCGAIKNMLAIAAKLAGKLGLFDAFALVA